VLRATHLDASAFLKLLVDEEHSEQLERRLDGAELWSSAVLGVEAHRAAMRLGISPSDVDTTLERVSLVLPAASTFHAARMVGNTELRTLDALHLATALEIGPEVASVVVYDRRLARATVAAGLEVEAPGLEPAWWDEPA